MPAPPPPPPKKPALYSVAKLLTDRHSASAQYDRLQTVRRSEAVPEADNATLGQKSAGRPVGEVSQ
jgi:hypothetical protein